MKIKIVRRKGGATVSIRAETEADKRALTDAVLSGRLTSGVEGITALKATGLAGTDSKPSPDAQTEGKDRK